jgi:hypothetical protein
MLRQCCAPASNRANANPTSRKDIQLHSKLSAGFTRNHLDSLGFLGLFLFSNPSSPARFPI